MKTFAYKQLFFIAHSIFCGVICFFTLYLLNSDHDSYTLVRPACIYLIGLFVWSVFTWSKNTNELFDPYILFLFSAMLFHGGRAILEVLNLNYQHILYPYKISTTVIVETLWLIILCLSFFHWGALFTHLTFRPVRPPSKHSDTSKTTKRFEYSLRLVGWAFLVISIVPMTFELKKALEIVFGGGYIAWFLREKETGIEAAPHILSKLFISGTIFLLCGSKEKKRGRIVALLLMLCFVTIKLILGHRGKAIMPLIAFLWIWDRQIHRLPRTTLLIGGLTLFFIVFPAIFLIRNLPGQERISFTVITEAYFSIENPVVFQIRQLGNTMRNVAFTLVLIPSTRDYAIGFGYINALTTIVPNLFWDIHPAETHNMSKWITMTVAPKFFEQGGGLGYSFIAEAYYNFSWLGAPIVLWLMGFFFARLALAAELESNVEKRALFGCCLAFILFYPRSESFYIVRQLAWYAFAPYVILLIVVKLNKHLKMRGSR